MAARISPTQRSSLKDDDEHRHSPFLTALVEIAEFKLYVSINGPLTCVLAYSGANYGVWYRVLYG
jgi:hypothetical protein